MFEGLNFEVIGKKAISITCIVKEDPMVGKRLKLLLPSKPQSLDAIRDEVYKFISGTPYETRASDILLAVSEACTNVVRHAYPKTYKKATVTVECVLGYDYLTVMVCDQGRGLAPVSGRPVFSEDGGFGLFLMQRISDRFKCHSSPGSGTVVELGFKNRGYHALKLNKRAAHVVMEPASAFLFSFVDMFSHPKRNLRAYRSYFEDGIFTAIDNLKFHWRSVGALLIIKARLGDLEEAIKVGKYAAAKVIAEDINNQTKIVRWGFYHIPLEGQYVLKSYLEYACNKLPRLEKVLNESRQEKLSDEAGTCDLTEKAETADLLAQMTYDICKLVSDGADCLVSLDKEPARLT